jgi:glucuronoarabinoxylan endo-1,4-beta-xylanase
MNHKDVCAAASRIVGPRALPWAVALIGSTALVGTAGCGGGGSSSSISVDPTSQLTGHAVATESVALGSNAQLIEGFGGSSAWQGAYSSTELDELFSYGDNQQIGCSIDRVRIDPGGSANWGQELSNAQGAAARGAKVIATPWTPPASMKSNDNVVGGSLNTSEYGAYATYLNSFVTYLSNGGVSLYAISMQNEPDANVTYESCGWTPAQMDTWMANNASAVGKTVFMPESESFNTSYSDTALDDSKAVGNIGFVAGHLYGASPFYYTNAFNKGKQVWMTEHYFDGMDVTSALDLAKEITDCMSIGDMSAYVWWYLKDPNIGLINSSDQVTINGYAMEQFAHFVRPGWYRENSTYNPDGSVYVTAYAGSGHSAIVAVNLGSSAVSQPFKISGGAPSSYTPYITSSSLSCAQQGAVGVSSGNFTYSLPAQSITTFYN